MKNSLQYRLSVDIGHLVVEAMHEGLSAGDAVEALQHCLALASRNVHFGLETPPACYRALHRDAAETELLRSALTKAEAELDRVGNPGGGEGAADVYAVGAIGGRA